MKLAEALALRADRQRYLNQLKSRLMNNVQIQEGDKPAEEPAVLLLELEQLATDLERLIQRIYRTNAVTELEAGLTLSDALIWRDMLKIRQVAYNELGQAANVNRNRMTRTEIKFVSLVDAAEMHQKANETAIQFRELDARIQEKNWLTELVD